ncbi:hypothetical protein [Oceanicoccus sp. KOV_DT_Chl]|uniref:hypothetical protein n=1 Tax=Oceanicoccus sp. KOV_DT_Chl TaxID=1904639 RepID=UPI000C7BCC4B|nr:hypothetical protein [Oceanicoccus sp. KOV_DT_Chl]
MNTLSKKQALSQNNLGVAVKKNFVKPALIASLCTTFFMVGCSDETDSFGEPPPAQSSASVQGAAVKGPITGGEVAIYRYDSSAADFKGELLDTGETNANAEIVGLEIPVSITDEENFLEQLFIIEVTGGTELTTGNAPVIESLRAIVTGQDYSTDSPFYVTPLTTFMLAILSNDRTDEPMVIKINNAQNRALAAFGFGLLDNVRNLAVLPPIITEGGDASKALAYRTAIESFSAITLLLKQQALIDASIDVSADELIRQMAADVVDGTIDGVDENGGSTLTALSVIANLQAVITSDPAALKIPGTNTLISSLIDILVQESSTVAPRAAAPVVANITLPATKAAKGGVNDVDGDGVIDGYDPFPNDGTRSIDADKDGFADDAGLSDRDLFPNDPTEWADRDGDGTGDNGDACPDDASEQLDTDGDGVCDNTDYNPTNPAIKIICDDTSLSISIRTAANCFQDSDNDGVINPLDRFPNNPRENADTDQDWPFPNQLDGLEDGDGYGDASDKCPSDPTEHLDTDNDTVCDGKDRFPTNPLETKDTDGDCPALSDGTDGCGDNLDKNICYNFITNTVVVGAASGSSSGIVGKAMRDTYLDFIRIQEAGNPITVVTNAFVWQKFYIDTAVPSNSRSIILQCTENGGILPTCPNLILNTLAPINDTGETDLIAGAPAVIAPLPAFTIDDSSGPDLMDIVFEARTIKSGGVVTTGTTFNLTNGRVMEPGEICLDNNTYNYNWNALAKDDKALIP